MKSNNMKNNASKNLKRSLQAKIKIRKSPSQHIQEKLKVSSIYFWQKTKKNKINLEKKLTEEKSFKIKLETFRSISTQIKKNRKKLKSTK